MRHFFLYRVVVFWIVILFADALLAEHKPKMIFKKQAQTQAGGVDHTMINVGNWGFWINAHGQTGHDPFTGSSGGYYPRGKATSIYMDGFMWGGWKGEHDRANPWGKLFVGGMGYRIGTIAGWIQEDGTAVDPMNERVGVYRIRSDWRDLTANQLRQGAAELNNVSLDDVSDLQMQQVLDQYAADWKNWPVDLGAPYYDVDEDGSYNPLLDDDGYPIAGKLTLADGSEIIGNDYPGVAKADQVAWLVVNDLNAARTQNHTGSDPMGLELQITLWAYNQPLSMLGQIIYKRYKLINKSADTIDSMFVAQYSDPDIGDYGDDLVGCDIETSLHFAYNGFPVDNEYTAFNMVPPAVGYDFLQGPVVDGAPGDMAIFDMKKIPGKKNLPMTSFGYNEPGGIIEPEWGTYEQTLRWYNSLNGYRSTIDLENPTPYTEGSGPNAGNPTKFPLWGDPETDPSGGISDIDGQGNNLFPGDRRMFAASGPFKMEPGNAQEIVVAIVAGQGKNHLNSVTDLKQTDKIAQTVYNSLFTEITEPPAEPHVKISVFEDAILLNWGEDHQRVAETEHKKILNYEFEGYNVYQLPYAWSNISDAGVKRIATFDVINAVDFIESFQYDSQYGRYHNQLVQFGTNSGIQRSLLIEKDYINERPLYKGSTYHFAVTAYSYNGSLVKDRALESAGKVISGTLQDPLPGVRYEGTAGTLLELDHTSGKSEGQVEIEVIDPSATTGHDYKVMFVEDADSNSATFGETVWELNDITAGTTVLSKQIQQSDLTTGDYPIVDGLLVKVSGPSAGINLNAPGPYGVYPGHMGYGVTGGTRWVSWPTNWGLETMGGALGNGFSFFGSDAAAGDYVNVEIRFAGCTDRSNTTSEGLRDASMLEFPDRWQKAVVYRRDLGYATQSQLADIPMQVWDTENNRQLKVAIVEDANNGTANFIWDMGWNGSAFADSGGREYLFILNDTYDTDYTEYLNGNLDGPYNGNLYTAGWGARGSHPYLESAFEIQIIASHVNTTADEFAFSAPAVTSDANLAKEDVDKINVFPNPYYAHNALETDSFYRFVTFTHLPQKATIRIFNLAGVQVRKLDKFDGSQFLRWNLRNESNLSVASGLYIVYIHMPELGKKKILKVMIIQGEQPIVYF